MSIKTFMKSLYHIELKKLKGINDTDKNTMMCNNYACWDLMAEINDKIANNEEYDLLYWMLLKDLKTII